MAISWYCVKIRTLYQEIATPSARNDRGGPWWVLLLWQNRVPTLSGDRLSLYSDSFTAHWLFQDDLPVFGVCRDGLAGQDAACQHQAAELRFDGVLDIAAQGPGAVGRVVGLPDDQVLCRLGQPELQLPGCQAAVQSVDLQIDDGADVLPGQGLVEDDLIQPVEELRTEGPAQQGADGLLRLGADAALAVDAVEQILAA